MMGLARNMYPQKVVALLPITDNRLAPSSLSPGDVVAYSNGLTVEVLNTDAEGRLILADALLCASKLNPAYVMDLATLTGSAHAAVGEGAMVAFESDATQVFEKLKAAGESVGEHIVQFPLLPEYDEQLKSTVADLKNIGGGLAGAITAALFLKRFTSFPWIHIDLSMALASAPCYYRTAGGTGSGVRLLLEFFDKASNLPISKP
jgi:leucyl aminopeptidase